MSKRLTEHHHTVKKLERLEALAAELQLRLEYDGYRMLVRDDETGEEFIYRDAEGEELTEWPYGYVWKLVRED